MVNFASEMLVNFDRNLHSSKTEDFSVLNSWARNATLLSKPNDIIGRIKYIGIATYQHLRMTFGIDTVKPDLRVLQVLEREFGIKTSKEKAIGLVEEMSKLVGYSVLFLDQIFVKYGSGYYRSEDLKIRGEVEKIILSLFKLEVPIEKISSATKWTVEQIENAVKAFPQK